MRKDEPPAGAAAQLKPLVSTAVRLAIAFGVAGTLAAGWIYAGSQSRAAVHASTSALNVTRVTLPRVEVVGRRETANVARVAASGATSPAELTGAF
ncbi:hypothetical protein GCM10027034_17570 [Ramlibacter solisilvae]|uniref:Uncharacterized protein n=1 Tax=Ramlibacter tataouinensis TaxID=94132 RepID=A0A127JVS9_9BURK|nr:hypothetical protein [Ramlibacter tataouinensis]AMO24090.1 hypothetical protein UC35_16100 [Ramlibacter tataouinensis]